MLGSRGIVSARARVCVRTMVEFLSFETAVISILCEVL